MFAGIILIADSVIFDWDYKGVVSSNMPEAFCSLKQLSLIFFIALCRVDSPLSVGLTNSQPFSNISHKGIGNLDSEGHYAVVSFECAPSRIFHSRPLPWLNF